jgi:formamidopyrimidine-DNA glycosylase
MPELPEVETVARGLHRRVAGDVIESVWIGPRKQPLKSSPEELVTALEGKKVEAARRVGKHIVVDLTGSSGAAQWVIHLGMTGRVLVCPPEVEVPKHTHFIAKLRSGRELRFVDPRMFGKLAVATAFTGPGTEPLDIGLADFIALFRRRKLPIKAALLNQKLLHGVGNIYADESLFRAGIRPRRRAGSLTRDELTRLHKALKQVLRQAIRAGGTTVNDYMDPDGAEGQFQLRLRAYGRTGEPCLVCKTPIKRIVVGGRSTHYCPRCQK